MHRNLGLHPLITQLAKLKCKFLPSGTPGLFHTRLHKTPPLVLLAVPPVPRPRVTLVPFSGPPAGDLWSAAQLISP